MHNHIRRTIYHLCLAAFISICTASFAVFYAEAEDRPSNPSEVSKTAEQDKLVEPRRFEFTVGDARYVVTYTGDGIRTRSKGATDRFRLPLDKGFEIEALDYFDRKGDLILVCGVTDGEAASGVVSRLDKKTLEQKWLADVPALNLDEAVIKGHWLYLTATGFIGKLDLHSGKYAWQHDYLYMQGPGIFNSFEQPVFEKEVVKFTEKLSRDENGPPVTIVVEDKTGRVINAW